MDWTKIDHFNKDEFKCSCCGEVHMDEEFVLMLDSTRDQAGIPFTVNSGYRCPKHDQEIGGSGNHTTGKAADVAATSSRARFLIIAAAIDVGFRRIGIGKTFVHLDDCSEAEEKPQEVIWLY